MPQITIPVGGLARSVHVQQVINWLRGDNTYAEAMSLTGFSSPTVYALTVSNGDDTNGLALAVTNDDESRRLFGVSHSGVVVKPHTADQSIFKVELFDGSTAFEVSDDGVNIGTANITTDTNTQTLTNKTLSAAVITSSRISDFLDITQPGASPPANPSANNLRMYALTGSDTIKIRNSSGTAVTIVDDATAQTLTNKTLTTPAIAGPVISDYVDMASQALAPSTPASGKERLYILTADNILRFKDSSAVVHTMVDLDSSQTLGSKTLTSPILTTPSISNYVSITQTSAPGTPSGAVYLYALTAGTDIRYKANSATERTLVDTDSSQTITNKTLGSGITLSTATLTAPVISNYADITRLAATPGTPAAANTRLHVRTDNNAYFTLPSGVEQLILTNSNATSVAASGFARGLALGSL